MTQTLYYFGPQYTFSHAAARHFHATLPDWSDATLLPFSSAETIFHHVQATPTSAAVVPYYNRTQGDVFDFMRFHLLEEVATFDLSVSLCICSQAKSIDQISTVFTKDTVPPQITHWMAGLPSRIKLIASTEISTAEAARRASINQNAAAICSPETAEIYRLEILETIEPDFADNFTRFGLFIAADAAVPISGPVLNRLEYPINLERSDLDRLAAGEFTIGWHFDGTADRPLHLGDLSSLISLHKFASFGNRLVHRFDTPLSESQATQVGQLFPNGLDSATNRKPDLWVSDLSAVQRFKASGEKGVLIDFVPGLNGYARMGYEHENAVPWPIPRKYWTHPSLARILGRYFSPHRMLESKVQAPLLMA